MDLLSGDFSVSGLTGQLTGAPAAQIRLSNVGGFPAQGAPHLSAIDLLAGRVQGQSALNLGAANFAAGGVLDFLFTATGAGVQTSGSLAL
ncbi:hypothetical protein V6O07_10315, partial [Arthrospira platensis SPKY2]